MLNGANLTAIVVTALICITVLESIALCKNIDGTILGPVIAIFGIFIGAAGSAIFGRKK